MYSVVQCTTLIATPSAATRQLAESESEIEIEESLFVPSSTHKVVGRLFAAAAALSLMPRSLHKI